MNTFPINSRFEKLASAKNIAATVEHQRLRLIFAKRLLGTVGTRQTLRAIYERSVKGEMEAAMELRRPELRHPLHVTARASDIWTYDEIFRQKVYDLPTGIDANVNGKAIVDLGAHIGLASAMLASRYPDSPIVAVEPHPRNQRHLAVNASQYEGQIKVLNGAATPTCQPIGMDIFGGNEQNFVANQFSSHASIQPETAVSPITPDDILAEIGDAEIGILKVDIEGAERALFESDEINPLLQQAQLLLIEIHERFTPGSQQAVADATRRNGFAPSYANQHTDMYVK